MNTTQNSLIATSISANISNKATAISGLKHSFSSTILIYYVGYSVSILLLSVALIILSTFKTLRCLRNVIHCNLIVAFIISDVLWIILHLFQSHYAIYQTIYHSGWLETVSIPCDIISILYNYFYTANFFWMFAEGIMMYQMVIVGFAHKIIALRYFLFIGWGMPFLLIMSWGIVNIRTHGNMCLLELSRSKFYYIYVIPILIVLLLNFVIFLMVIKLWIEKTFSSSNANGNINYLKSFKGFIFLIPHLGITYLITIYPPHNAIYRTLITPILLSSQGFFVALYCCFMNKEVRQAFIMSVKNLENRRRSSSTHETFLFSAGGSEVSSLPHLFMKRLSLIPISFKRASVQSDPGSLLHASNVGKDNLTPYTGVRKSSCYTNTPTSPVSLISRDHYLQIQGKDDEDTLLTDLTDTNSFVKPNGLLENTKIDNNNNYSCNNHGDKLTSLELCDNMQLIKLKIPDSMEFVNPYQSTTFLPKEIYRENNAKNNLYDGTHEPFLSNSLSENVFTSKPSYDTNFNYKHDEHIPKILIDLNNVVDNSTNNDITFNVNMPNNNTCTPENANIQNINPRFSDYSTGNSSSFTTVSSDEIQYSPISDDCFVKDEKS